MPLSVAFPYVEIPTVHFIHSNCIISLPYVYLPTYVRAKSLYVYSKSHAVIKFVFSMKATKIDEIFTVDLTVRSKYQIDGEDFVKFCGLLRKHEL